MKRDNKELLERLSTSRRAFNATAFAELDRNLSDDEREEWNAIYASFSSRSLLRNTVIGLESIQFPTDDEPEQVLICMVVMRHLVKVLIPLPLFWIEPTGINPNSVIGADVDYIIIGVDREGECAIARLSLQCTQMTIHVGQYLAIGGGVKKNALVGLNVGLSVQQMHHSGLAIATSATTHLVKFHFVQRKVVQNHAANMRDVHTFAKSRSGHQHAESIGSEQFFRLISLSAR